MPPEFPHQHLDPAHTTWHITFGTYGTRLHGGSRPSVDKQHNELDTPFVPPKIEREDSAHGRMKFPPRFLTNDQRQFAETELPRICERGGWIYRVCSAAPDHVHLLCDIVPEVHGERVRRLVKRWLGQALSERWPIPDGASWWAEEGSNIAIHDESYLNNAFSYIARLADDTVDALNGVEDDPARLLAMYHFHVNLFADPKEASFGCTWEDAAAMLERLPRMILELDGSFVISGNVERAERAGASPPPSADATRWQVDGHLFDFAGHLHRLELHGQCPQEAFDGLLRSVGWPQQSLLFELVREGITVDEQQFRNFTTN